MNQPKGNFIWYMANFRLESNYNHKNEAGWVLEQNIEFKPVLRNEEIYLYNYFFRMFGFYPRVLFHKKPYGILLFVSNKPFEILNRKYINELNYFQNKIGLRIYILKTPSTFGELIEFSFSHVNIIKITCDEKYSCNESLLRQELIKDRAHEIRIYLEIKDSEIPLALGRKGYYIHLVNAFLKTFSNVCIYLRS